MDSDVYCLQEVSKNDCVLGVIEWRRLLLKMSQLNFQSLTQLDVP